MFFMAGILGQLIRPPKRAVEHCTFRVDSTALELETAKEILAEVFRVRISEVDEMIQNRFEEAHICEDCPEEVGQWPQEFRLDM